MCPINTIILKPSNLYIYLQDLERACLIVSLGNPRDFPDPLTKAPNLTALGTWKQSRGSCLRPTSDTKPLKS